MNNNNKIKITDLSTKAQKLDLKPLSRQETTQIVGGLVPWCRPGRGGKGGPTSYSW